MKGILILLAILGVVCAAPVARVELVADAPEANPFVDFIHGFLDGLNVKGDINKILECIKGGEGVIEKIIEALNYLIHIDIKHMEDIIKGVMMLVEAIQEIYKIIQPCISSFEEIKKIFEQIISTNIMKIVWRIIANAGQFIGDIKDAIASFAKGDFKQAGHDLGDIVYRLFLASLTDTNPAFEFVKGLLEGLNEKGDINKVLECVHGLEPASLK
jgi:phage-related protein